MLNSKPTLIKDFCYTSPENEALPSYVRFKLVYSARKLCQNWENAPPEPYPFRCRGACSCWIGIAPRAQDERLATSHKRLLLPHAIVMRLHAHYIGVFIVTPETNEHSQCLSSSLSLQVGCYIQDEAIDISQFVPQDAHDQAPVVVQAQRQELRRREKSVQLLHLVIGDKAPPAERKNTEVAHALNRRHFSHTGNGWPSWRSSNSLPLSAGFFVQDEAMDVARSVSLPCGSCSQAKYIRVIEIVKYCYTYIA